MLDAGGYRQVVLEALGFSNPAETFSTTNLVYKYGRRDEKLAERTPAGRAAKNINGSKIFYAPAEKSILLHYTPICAVEELGDAAGLPRADLLAVDTGDGQYFGE